MNPNTTVQTRPVQKEDLLRVISLINHEILNTVNIFRHLPLDEAATERWWNLHGEGRYQAVVAERWPTDDHGPNGSPVFAGWATFSPHSAYEGYDRTAEISVWVEANSRGYGCGRKLVNTLLKSCQERNFRAVVSRIESNNLASLRLHESCGFTRAGRLDDVGEKFGQSLSVIFMQYHVRG